jgi:ZIP family zinc transporter
MQMSDNIIYAFLLTAFAGLSTGIGSLIAYFIKKPKMIYLSLSLGFSGGVMIYISFMELMPGALDELGDFWGVFAFFLGILFIGLIDFLIPEEENPHHLTTFAEVEGEKYDGSLMRTGLFTALAIGIHNFPEGLATFGTTLSDLKYGIIIAIAIAIHNIPEGISVSMPIFYASGDKRKALFYSFMSGLAEPVGALVGFLILLPFLSPVVLSGLLAFVAGIMVYISLDELLPMAHRYGDSHIVLVGIILGMLVMAVSLLII